MSEAVVYSSSDRIAVITLNPPEPRDAVNRDVAAGLERLREKRAAHWTAR